MAVARHPSTSRHGHPSGLFALLLKAPVPVYHAGMGWLFGRRLLMLSHRGRRTGQFHETVVEVIHYDPRTGESIVTAGWGTATQWYRNIQAEAAMEIRTGHEHYVPVQRFLGDEEARELLATYAMAHQLAARLILRWLGYEWSDEGREQFYRTVRLVGFRPR